MANECYRENFNLTPVKDRAVLLPHCLINQKMSGEILQGGGDFVHSMQTLQMRRDQRPSVRKGVFSFYITPSSGFTKDLRRERNWKAAVRCNMPL